MLPVPRDWSVEASAPAHWYQACIPEVLRHINLVTNRDAEIVNIFNDSMTSTNDFWETIHIQSMSGEWDSDREVYKRMGFGTVFTAEEIARFNGNKNYESDFGYFDEGISLARCSLTIRLEGLEYLFKYLDYVRTNRPKNRFYLSWFDSTTHWPFILPPQWKERHQKKYYDVITNEPGEPGDSFHPQNVHSWLNSLRWTDDIVEELIMGFRQRGLEDETLFIMYVPRLFIT